MKKIYECDLVSLSMNVSVNGKGRTINFRGGTYGGGMAVNARYTTEDEEEMAAIEASARFKIGRISIVGVYGKPAAKKATKATDAGKGANVAPGMDAKTSATNANTVPGDSIDNTDQGAADSDSLGDQTPDAGQEATEYPDVVNFQQAKNTLITKHDVVFEGHANKEAVLKAAGELNVTFPNWN